MGGWGVDNAVTLVVLVVTGRQEGREEGSREIEMIEEEEKRILVVFSIEMAC